MLDFISGRWDLRREDVVVNPFIVAKPHPDSEPGIPGFRQRPRRTRFVAVKWKEYGLGARRAIACSKVPDGGTILPFHRMSRVMTKKSTTHRSWVPLIGLLAILAASVGGRAEAQGERKSDKSSPATTTDPQGAKKLARATFGGGCFWCTEAVFQRVKGVESVVSGYAGGTVENPTYAQVCTGTTGHAEVIQITFDPEQVPFAKLLEVHWKTHDPTTLNRQGYDVGTQYRSVIFYEDEAQKKTAEEYRKKLNREVYDGKIVTEISPLTKFYPAEDDHQNYYNLNSKKGYCQSIIVPKLKKFDEVFKDIKK